MGILPLQFEEGQSVESLGLDGTETFTIAPIDFSKGLPEPAHVAVEAVKPSGGEDRLQHDRTYRYSYRG